VIKQSGVGLGAERLVAVVAQPPMHLSRELRIIASVTDEYPGHSSPEPTCVDRQRSWPATWSSTTRLAALDPSGAQSEFDDLDGQLGDGAGDGVAAP